MKNHIINKRDFTQNSKLPNLWRCPGRREKLAAFAEQTDK